MKLLFLLILLFNLKGGSSFYALQFESLSGRLIQTASYQGKKVIIAVVSAEAPDLLQLRYLDSLQRASVNLEVIGVLTEDFGKKAKLKEVKDSTASLSITLTQPFKVKKNKEDQHPLFTWLTSQKGNQHFDLDVQSEGQLFVISGKGTLYSVLIKETPKEVVTKVISQPFAE